MHNKTSEIILFLYLLLTFSIPSTLGIFRKSTSATGSVTTATWSVSLNQTGVSNTMQLTANGQEASYNLNVVSGSDVDVVYTIVVSNIPSGVQVKLGTNGTYQIPSSGTVTFPDAGTILYNASPKENTHTLYFKANSGATLVTNQTVDIDVIFKQDL